MASDSEMKEVRFDKYCKTCEYWSEGREIPFCDDCLEESMREGSEVPVKWKKK